MDNNINFHDQETLASIEQEGEEALSLCNFPFTSDELRKHDLSNPNIRKSSSEPSDFFEFFNDISPETFMSHAEDIIFCGKLIPYKKQPLFDDQILKSYSSSENSCYINDLPRRYCESLPELNSTQSSSNTGLTRSSRSLDSRKVRHNTSHQISDIHRNFTKKTVKPENKLRWYVMMFGSVKFPPEMDLHDIKSRQVRRRHSGMEMDGGEKGVGGRRRPSWGQDLLRVLSCKSQDSVAVMASTYVTMT